MPNKITINEKEFIFKRPTLKLSIEVDELVTASELFEPIRELAEIYKTDKKRFTKLSSDWLRFCELVFDGELTDDLQLENLVYPDDVMEVQIAFFTLPWEKTMKKFDESLKNLRDLQPQESNPRQSQHDGN